MVVCIAAQEHIAVLIRAQCGADRGALRGTDRGVFRRERAVSSLGRGRDLDAVRARLGPE
eukprot:1425115-Rhodomonas_salina.1